MTLRKLLLHPKPVWVDFYCGQKKFGWEKPSALTLPVPQPISFQLLASVSQTPALTICMQSCKHQSKPPHTVPKPQLPVAASHALVSGPWSCSELSVCWWSPAVFWDLSQLIQLLHELFQPSHALASLCCVTLWSLPATPTNLLDILVYKSFYPSKDEII